MPFPRPFEFTISEEIFMDEAVATSFRNAAAEGVELAGWLDASEGLRAHVLAAFPGNVHRDVTAYCVTRFERFQAWQATKAARLAAPLPAIGALIYVDYNCGKQPARVVGYTSTGKVKCRGFNMSWGKWLPNLKNIPKVDIVGPVEPEMVFPADDVVMKPRR